MSKVEAPELAIVSMTEKRDENQIIETMRGQVVKEWVYTIEAYDSATKMMKKVTSLSYAGVKEAIRRRGNISWYPCDCCHKPVHTEETPDEIRAVVTAWDLNSNVKFLGAASASKKHPFTWVLAVNKAERNALRKFLPEKAIAMLIEEYLRPKSPAPLPVPKATLG